VNNESGESPRIHETSKRRARELDSLESIFSILASKEQSSILWTAYKLTRPF
jgi:hypothetical protein